MNKTRVCKVNPESPTINDPRFHGNIISWIVINICLTIFIIGGNFLSILAVRLCRRLRAVVSNLFILSLAVSDLFVGFTLPYHLAFYLTSGLSSSHIFCILKFYVIILASSMSIWNLLSIAIDRYVAIMYPLRYKSIITKRVVITIIGLGWIVGMFLACIPIFWNHWSTAAECEIDQILPLWYVAGIITPGFIAIWIFILLIYWRVGKETSKHVKELRKQALYKNIPTERNFAQILFHITGAFTVCWIPYFVVACGQFSSTSTFSSILYKGVFTLAMTNSAVNPLIYAWKNSSFRKSCVCLLRCKNPNYMKTTQFNLRQFEYPRTFQNSS